MCAAQEFVDGAISPPHTGTWAPSRDPRASDVQWFGCLLHLNRGARAVAATIHLEHFHDMRRLSHRASFHGRTNYGQGDIGMWNRLRVTWEPLTMVVGARDCEWP